MEKRAELRRIEPRLFLLGEHLYLDSSDECYFANSYDCPQQGGVKPLVISLKLRDEMAVLKATEQLASLLPGEWARKYTFVPMPPSHGEGDSVKAIVQKLPVADVRALVVQSGRTSPSHLGWRLAPRERSGLLRLDETKATPKPNAVVIVDDVLSTGSHFRAAKMIVREKWPSMRVIGLFLARTCSYWYVCNGPTVGRPTL
jgi:predicted amidophosphoribosyltransferase